eukprot:1160680-Pelagomonas_calceolata.AAC.15
MTLNAAVTGKYRVSQTQGALFMVPRPCTSAFPIICVESFSTACLVCPFKGRRNFISLKPCAAGNPQNQHQLSSSSHRFPGPDALKFISGPELAQVPG